MLDITSTEVFVCLEKSLNCPQKNSILTFELLCYLGYNHNNSPTICIVLADADSIVFLSIKLLHAYFAVPQLLSLQEDEVVLICVGAIQS